MNENTYPPGESSIDELMHENTPSFIQRPPSSIPLQKPEPPIPVNVTLTANAEHFWINKANSLLSDYRYGKTLGTYGNNELTNQVFFDRLYNALTNCITNECKKQGVTSDSFQQHFQALEAILKILAKEIDIKSTKGYNTSALVASLHGFLTSYLETVKIKG